MPRTPFYEAWKKSHEAPAKRGVAVFHHYNSAKYIPRRRSTSTGRAFRNLIDATRVARTLVLSHLESPLIDL
jgi:hypothetical protein